MTAPDDDLPNALFGEVVIDSEYQKIERLPGHTYVRMYGCMYIRM
jgi:hypothetical protein